MNSHLPHNSRILIAGSGGFIGGHLVKYLTRQGYSSIRCIDRKPIEEWFQVQNSATNVCGDLIDNKTCLAATSKIEYVFNLAAENGGVGFISRNDLACLNAVSINANLARAARENNVRKFLFASSACAYPISLQMTNQVPFLRESDMNSIDPQCGYGLEKLFSERLLSAYGRAGELSIRIARLHNIYGPLCDYDSIRAKAPAAISREIASAIQQGRNSVSVWGDGNQVRTFLFIDDCISALVRLMASDFGEPINIGSRVPITVKKLAETLISISGSNLTIRYLPSKPVGVRSRACDASLAARELGWVESTQLQDGCAILYDYIRTNLAGVNGSRSKTLVS
jgi:GDP-D-mannose 3', 5'-epimerase